MEIEVLRWFVAVAQGKTVSDTADAFGISQPAVTRGLQRLSRHMGVSLTEPAGRRIRLTAAGRAFAPGARRMLEEWEAAAQAVAEANDPRSGTIRLGFLSPLGTWLVPSLLLAFRTERPRARFELRHDGATRILHALLQGELDLLLTSPPPDSQGPQWEQLFEEELVVAVPASHRLASRRAVEVAELRDESWVLLSPGYGLRQRAEEICQAAGFTPRAAFEGHDVATLYGLIGAGSGIGLFPATPDSPATVRQVQLQPALQRAVGLASMPARFRPPSVDAFAQLVREAVPALASARSVRTAALPPPAPAAPIPTWRPA